MSKKEYESIEKKLKSIITKTEKSFRQSETLEEKIIRNRELKSAREELRQHKLRYFDFQ